MVMWQIIPLVALLAAMTLSTPQVSRVKRQVEPYYDDFIDPYKIDNSFKVECGNSTHKQMRVVYRGNARKLFSTGNNSCEFVQEESGHYVVADAMTDPKCQPIKAVGLELYTLDVTIQKKYVHFESDPRYLISCNYELGREAVSASQTVDNEWVERTAHLVMTNNTAQSTFTLSLRDTKNKDVQEVRIGEFVQLVAFMDPQGGEVSFRIWNCLASSNDTGVHVEHSILIEGCGDANVIKAGRGFRTSSMQDDDGNTIRIARSVFFRAFALLNNPTVKFSCDFIIKKDTSADGPSCDESRESLITAGRKKREAAEATEVARTRRQVGALGLPEVETDVIQLIDSLPTDGSVVTYALNKKNDPKMLPGIFYKNTSPRHRQRMRRPLPARPGRQGDAEYEPASILTQPLVIGLLVTCAILVLVPVVIACGIFFTRTRSVRYVKPRYSASPPIYMPDSPHMADNVDYKLVR